ncbi:uncharacterized protein LOC129771401 [Toxorhynchites rutilus septentrionalis]|uniref:uncharacterized protein LOC129771401 n=1 Tax=Toxorhynchites rutilus septentrionalis TaxID=329112 RepID=UPI002479847D|nr:uncharacterized protein LOC129771401 [Toxorhynchites rutilus septentrionalis]
MFKIICLFALVAIASVSAKADPKPGVFAYTAPAAYVAPAVYEQTFHGNIAPAAAFAYSSPYLAAPLAYSAYEPYVAAAPASVLLK